MAARRSACATALLTRFGTRSLDDALALLAKHHLSKVDGKAPDDRLDGLRQTFKVRLQIDKLVGVDALLKETEDGYTVTLPHARDVGSARARFSLAHELAHLAIFEATGLTTAFGHRSQDLDDAEANEIERLCDILAAEFLMPRAEWGRLLFELGVSAAVISELADRYGVSAVAAARRAVEVGPWSIAILFWREITDRTALECRYLWSSIRTALPGKPDPLYANHQPTETPFAALEHNRSIAGKTTLHFGDDCVTFFGESWPTFNNHLPVATLLLDEQYPKTILEKASRRTNYWSGSGKLFET